MNKFKQPIIFLCLGLILGSIGFAVAQTPGQNDIPAIVSRANPAVVSIVGSSEQRVLNPLTGQIGTQRRSVSGTGFLVSSNGYVVTNTHVISAADASSYKVYTTSGQQYSIQVVDQDPTTDIAVIKIAGSNFPFLRFADSDNARLGDTAIAIGNALGEFRNTVSVGVISGLSRTINAAGSGQVEQLDQLLQTDAAINPGNSGGPLLNASGAVIGVNVAVVQGSSNIGFAIPSNVVSQAVNSVIQNGRIIKPFLGVRYVQINPVIQQANDLPSDYGAWVHAGDDSDEPAVQGDSPASNAGIRENDVIIAIDGVSLKDSSLASVLRTKSPGQAVSITLIRSNRNINIQATLGST